MAKRINVVVSQSQSQNPAKRDLEESVVAALLFESGIDVTVIPHLYDLDADGTGLLALQGIPGDMIVLSWLYDRATRWTLDRHDIRGREGTTLLESESDEEEEETVAVETEVEEKERVIDSRPLPNRTVYCLDLRMHNSAEPYLEEIKRIVAEASTDTVDLMSWVSGSPQPEQLSRYLNPTNGSSNGNVNGNGQAADTPAGSQLKRVEQTPERRWYPVIDYSRCTNCMECVDFCLFGVYGVDGQETILVEQPDNCRKGCPACSRVCPENAIMFPQHKSPAIAGAAGELAGLKIDLSQLFGAPDAGKSAAEVAATERDEQLLLAGREVVGMPKRQVEPAEHDELDDLIDSLDEMDL